VTASWLTCSGPDLSTAPGAQARDVVDVLVGFTRTVRQVGVAATTDQLHAMVAALAHLDALDTTQVYWAGRLTLCSDPADLARYDTAFAAYFGARAVAAPRQQEPPVRLRSVAFEPEVSGADEQPDHDPLAVQASRVETLRQRDLSELTARERQELLRLFARLAPRTSQRRTRRYAPAGRGRVDAGRTVRLMLSQGGEPGQLAHRRRRTKPRRLLLLIDVSGSMQPYADSLLRFAHAATRAAPTRTESFTIGTRLTRITRELRRRDPDGALAGAARAIPDWSGGTRLGDMLKAMLDLWGQRGLARGAVVVLCSDGWERGDPALLGEQVARLRRLAHTVIWVNPHKGHAGFAPVTGGMIAALPHVSELVAGHSFEALERLAELIAAA
jgi:uncharacterized protein with von Willebrand factor type A (vWA) domain